MSAYPGSALEVDFALEVVYSYLQSIPNLHTRVGEGLRRAFDEVIDGPRTGRYRIEELEKTEKTYIGTKVEIILRSELELLRGKKLDNLICGHEVDTKFSLSGEWMIPREAMNELCLVLQGNDNDGTFSLGLIRAIPEILRDGANLDSKKSIAAHGKHRIRWLLYRCLFPRNFLLNLCPRIRDEVLAPSSGVQRMKALFRNVTGQIIPRSAILQVAQQRDPLKRARELKVPLAYEGLMVLCAKYEFDRSEFIRHGFTDFALDDWLSIRYRD